jgi:hypothetical protein
MVINSVAVCAVGVAEHDIVRIGAHATDQRSVHTAVLFIHTYSSITSNFNSLHALVMSVAPFPLHRLDANAQLFAKSQGMLPVEIVAFIDVLPTFTPIKDI